MPKRCQEEKNSLQYVTISIMKFKKFVNLKKSIEEMRRFGII